MQRVLPMLAPLAAALVLSACGGGDSDPSANTAAPAAAASGASASTQGERAIAGLNAAVVRALQQAKGEQVQASYGSSPQPVVEVQRQSADNDWVFGGGYFPLPAHAEDTSPITALFIAHRTADGWEVALEDSDRFTAMSQEAPEGVMSGTERKLFKVRAINKQQRLSVPQGANDVGLSMPFQLNGAAWGTAGVHGDSGTSRPYNAIDFWGGDGRVLASRGGVAYKFCTNSRWPYIKIVHDNGWATGYYHTNNQASISNGQYINEGQFIGMIGVELPCGGRASGNHVHWTLWHADTGYGEAVNGKVIGGWTWYEGSQAYSGYAVRNGRYVYANQSGLVNYGHGGTSTTEPCSGTGCNKYTGSFSGSGGANYHPGTGGFYYAGGTLQAWLKGASGTDFDLVLGRYNSSTGQWDKVAGSDSPSSDESLSFNAGAGYYRWRINQYSGTGSYTLWTKQ